MILEQNYLSKHGNICKKHLHCSAQNSNCLLFEALCVHKSLSEMSWTNSLIQSSVQNHLFPPSRATDDGFGTIKMKANKTSLLTTQVASSGRILRVAHFRSFIGDDHPLSPLDDEDTGKNVQNSPLPSIYMLLKLYHKQNMSKTLRSH